MSLTSCSVGAEVASYKDGSVAWREKKMPHYVHKGEQKLIESRFSKKTFSQLTFSLLGTQCLGSLSEHEKGAHKPY